MSSPLAAPDPWDLVAPAYAVEVVPQLEPFSREALRLAALAPSARILDVAAGPGTLTSVAAAAGYVVTAVDFAPDMIAALRAHIASQGLSAHVDARVGDGMALPFEDASFAGAFSMFGLIFFPDRGKGFHELHRVLEHGAPAVVSSWMPLEPNMLLASAIAALNEVAAPPSSGPPPPYRHRPPLATREECVAEMSAAGFRDVVVHELTYEPPATSVADGWATMARTSAPIALRRASLGDRWAKVEREVLERLHEKHGDGPVTMPLRAWLTFGRR
jgi:SAM-dependent methyltransferase